MPTMLQNQYTSAWTPLVRPTVAGEVSYEFRQEIEVV
jgi:hypothetical protein